MKADRRYFRYRRLWPSARAPARAIEPLDFPAGAKNRLYDSAYRKKVCVVVRSTGNIRYELSTRGTHGPGPAAAGSLQDENQSADRGRIQGNFPADLRLLWVDFSEDTMAYLLDSFYVKYKIPFAGFHPKFIAEHVIAACNYLGTTPQNLAPDS